MRSVLFGLALSASLLAQEHWAFQAPAAIEPPTGATHPVDAFLVDRAPKELEPTPVADARTLLRRTSLAVTGLPPAPAEIVAFEADIERRGRSVAFGAVVDRLLASPAYGEHQARRWLDLARYADTNGYEKDKPRTLWPWRDWVIAAYNDDMPFDRFTIEQMAGDLLPNPTTAQRIATGFHRNSLLNDEGGIDAEEFRIVAVKDRVDATARAWLGLTFDCAQCHDHKYDPMSQREYYSFYAFFDSTQDSGVGSIPNVPAWTGEQSDEAESLRTKLTELEARLSFDDAAFRSTFETWVASTRARRAGSSEARIETTPWHSLGPLTAGSTQASFDRRFAPERRVSLQRRQAGQSWTVQPSWADNTELPLEQPPQSALYLYRTIETERATRTHLIVGRGEGIRVWLNGREVHQELVTPSDGLTRETVAVQLKKGSNELLLKVVNDAGDSAFSFAVQTFDEPPEVTAALERAPDSWSSTEREAVATVVRRQAPALDAVRRQLEQTRQEIAKIESVPTMVLAERKKRRVTRVLERGSFQNPGAVVTPDVPEFLHDWPATAPRNRLGLARWLVAPSNPLFARVAVNRIWTELFGSGLVTTPEDFGTRGAAPTHPKLLDWLALRFQKDGYTMKSFIRLLLTSDAWQRSSSAAPPQRAIDPTNRWRMRGPSYRLTFEQIRDSALYAGGRLDRTLGGPSAMPYQPPGIWENSFSFHDTSSRWQAAEDATRYRRGLYLYLRRTALHPTWLLFDGPNRDVSCARRSRTNTPTQALALWNDPSFVEAAGGLALRLIRDHGTPDERLDHLMLATLGRAPTASEAATLLGLLDEARASLARGDSAGRLLGHARIRGTDVETAAWIVVANTVLALDEFVTLR